MKSNNLLATKKLFFLLILPVQIGFSQQDSIRLLPPGYIHEIQLNGTTFSGPGWDSVVKTYRQSSVYALGEIHGTLEIPMLYRQLLSEKEADVYVTEIDSLSLQLIERDLAFSDTVLIDYPGSYGMYSYTAERYLLSDLQEDGTRLLGIDEIHPVSIRLLLLELMNKDALSEKTRKLLRKQVEYYNKVIAEGKVSALNSYKKRRKIKSQLLKIKDRELNGKSPIIDHILANWRAFSMYSRATKMKGQSRIILANTDTTTNPVIVFKFGGAHVSKTTNTIGKRDVGFVIDSFATQNQLKSYHLLTIITQGDLAFPATMNGSSARSFNVRTDRFSTHLVPFAEAFKEEKCLFFDLKGYRRELANEGTLISKNLDQLLRNYDGLVMLRSVNPSPIPR